MSGCLMLQSRGVDIKDSFLKFILPYQSFFFLTGYWWWWHRTWLGRKDCSMGGRWLRTKSSFLSRTNGLTQRVPQSVLESNYYYWIANSQHFPEETCCQGPWQVMGPGKLFVCPVLQHVLPWWFTVGYCGSFLWEFLISEAPQMGPFLQEIHNGPFSHWDPPNKVLRKGHHEGP